ncbi:transporter substrate-binding domain-containing protein [Desulfotalea psychrophila]|uniref:Similar to substrate-binding periplasmic protein (FliY) n=1 Tax=Desulfotalea psychrophila (strain LSv54 / DSM 12343) TaxID=177439 RepID=Q6AS57_DESPS|nr:transporter substrate-binding domain-containing protein [Desulfotalea psychrophila]CAG34818.1 similar to substrate-binding periplasmic protein (FliY) [Desulfotalea psychrophila LSv54]
MKVQKIAFFTLALLCIMMLGTVQASQIQGDITRSSVISKIQKKRVLRVGMDVFQPWAMKNKKGELVGFEIDVARRLAKDMGVRVEFVPTPWSGIVPALLTGKFDVLIGGIGITSKRALKVNFTIPYDYSGMGIVAHRKLAKGFSSIEDFNRPEIEIAVKLGTSAVTATKKYMPRAKLRMFDTEIQAYQELRNGKVAAVVGSAPRPVYEALDYQDILFNPIADTFSQEPIAFALRKGDPDALAFFNAWIRIVDHEGWLKERHNYWFNSKEWIDQVE